MMLILSEAIPRQRRAGVGNCVHIGVGEVALVLKKRSLRQVEVGFPHFRRKNQHIIRQIGITTVMVEVTMNVVSRARF